MTTHAVGRYKAVDDHIQSGMVVGLGTGSTAYFAVERIGQKLASGELKDIICIPTSERTREQAASLGIPLCTLNEKSSVDVAIDGADAVDPNMCLIKGGGGALLREKMVEAVSAKFICIVDETKLCTSLGPSFPLPVEITPFCHEHTMRIVATLTELAGCKAVLRTGDCSNSKSEPGGQPAVTDNGNYIVRNYTYSCVELHIICVHFHIIYINIHVYTYMRINMCVYIYIYVCICLYIYIYIFTYV